MRKQATVCWFLTHFVFGIPQTYVLIYVLVGMGARVNSFDASNHLLWMSPHLDITFPLCDDFQVSHSCDDIGFFFVVVSSTIFALHVKHTHVPRWHVPFTLFIGRNEGIHHITHSEVIGPTVGS
jgi:hypothetical protein